MTLEKWHKWLFDVVVDSQGKNWINGGPNLLIKSSLCRLDTDLVTGYDTIIQAPIT